MASLYDSASLVMIPSGVKEDKLYSIKPTDGSGDFTFSRGSDIQATRVNSSGLIEKAKVNLLLQSNNFDTTWLNVSSTETGGQSGYDGSNDAWKLEKSASAARLYQNISYSGVNTFSVYAKAGTLNHLMINNGTNSVFFDIQNGSVGTNSAGGGSVDASIEAVGAAGWYRLSVVSNVSATTIRIYPAQADNDFTGTSGYIYLQDAQLNHGLIAQDYVETTTTAVVEGLTADLPRLDYSGGASCPSLLLEPSRTNVVPRSEWSTNLVNLNYELVESPEGVNNALRLIENTATGQHFAEFNADVVSGTTYTFSFFCKKGSYNEVSIPFQGSKMNATINVDFDAETASASGSDVVANTEFMEPYGNGWYRVGFNGTPDADGNMDIYVSIGPNGVGGYTGDGVSYTDFYGFQAEAGSYPTSYIPTYSAAANRGQDVPTISSGSSIFNDNEGTFFLEIEGISDSSSARVVTIGDGTSSNRVQIFYHLGTNITTNIISGGSAQVSGFTTTTDQEQNHKVLIRYATNNAKMYLDGVEIASDTSVTPPSGLNVLRFNNGTGGSLFEGEVKQLLYFDSALTDAECIALTTI